MQMPNLISSLVKKFITISILLFSVFNSYAQEIPASLVLKESFGSDPYNDLAYHDGYIVVSGKLGAGAPDMSANLDVLKYGNNGFELASQFKLTSSFGQGLRIDVINVEYHSGYWLVLASSDIGQHVFSASIKDGNLNLVDELYFEKYQGPSKLLAGHNNNLYLTKANVHVTVTHLSIDESGKLQQKETVKLGRTVDEVPYDEHFSVSYDDQALYVTKNQDNISADFYKLPLANDGTLEQMVELKLDDAKPSYYGSYVSGNVWLLSYHLTGFQVARIEGNKLKIIYESEESWYRNFEVKGNQIIAVDTFNFIDVYEIKDSETVLFKSRLNTEGFLSDTTMVDNTLLVTKDYTGIEAIELDDNGTLTSLHAFSQSGEVSDIAMHENELAVSAFLNNLHFWRTDSSRPIKFESTYKTFNAIQGVEWLADEVIINAGAYLESHRAEDLKNNLNVGIRHGSTSGSGPDGHIVKTDNGFIAKSFRDLIFIDDDKNIVSNLELDFWYSYIAVSNNLLFVTNFDFPNSIFTEIIIYDISDLSKVTELSRIAHEYFSAGEVAVKGHTLFAFGAEELLIFDISEPNKPVKKRSLSLSADTRHSFSYIYGDYLVAILEDKGILFDISTPENPIQLFENNEMNTNGIGNGFGKEIYTVASHSAGRINRININYAPTQKDLQIELNEDEQATVALTPVDAENDTVTISVAVEPEKGIVSIQDDNKLVYEGMANQNGTDHVKLLIQDTHGGASYSSVAINIKPVYDALSFKSDVFNMSVISGETASSLLDVVNVDGGKLQFEVTEQAANGTATVNEQGLLTYTANAGSLGTDQFVITVTDEMGAKVSRTVNVNTTGQANNSDSGGGSFSLFGLFALFICGARRRFYVHN
ncbi:hypothetical protein A7985_13635 [Pseudoalteromonas luteoviolacea]|uniref:Cadherin domain-containing protein n=1 Tax=Pseudoalteromonas luteoviolacea TaxID=43657 RepID=A0A1C0TPH7_9GAMM|nr:Ig-like domain-containing protein [Pseudoalteromonas luteoviolacea]OCQ20834.1 hypothetical protein A7985_13635 [Pseudoalteromonas luteoviolacea]